MANSFTYSDFKRTLSGCSESEYKQEKLLNYLKTDKRLFDKYFERISLELSLIEQTQRLKDIQARDDEIERKLHENN